MKLLAQLVARLREIAWARCLLLDTSSDHPVLMFHSRVTYLHALSQLGQIWEGN